MASILLIEDHPNQRLLYRMELEDWGHQVQAPENVQSALATIRESPPDLVVLDSHLSDYREIGALPTIKEIAPELPVIIYTGESLFGDDYRYFLADVCLTKSSDVGPLLQAVDKLLNTPEQETVMEAWTF